MRPFFHRRIAFATLVLPALLAAASLACEPHQCSFLVRGATPAWESKIEAALDEPTTLEFIETPLQDVIDYLKDLHQFEIQIDTRSLEDVGVGTDTPITRNLKGISLRAALRLMLLELDLTYVLRNEVLLITTPATVRREPVTRVYTVTELLDFGEPADELAMKLMQTLAATSDPPGRAKGGFGEEELLGGKAGGPKPASKDVSPMLRIVPYRQTILVMGSIEDHEAMHRLLHNLSLGLRGKTDPPVRVKQTPATGHTPSQPAAAAPKRGTTDAANAKSSHDKQSPKADSGKDPFAGGAHKAAPATTKPAGKNDPFGGGKKKEDPFG